ncbi:N-methyl-L-tryptophan oxidase [Salmonella enterica subsp. enterica serovar Choleraesuis]|nr:N-methyl-L-tryptophan oxidase [Salmonella enterica subsp. enterica serovar Choleraesuis]
MHYDLIIVGSGSIGAACGYYAARAGMKVLMIDKGHPPHDQGSHHGQTRLIRHAYGEGEKYVPLVLRAQKLWDELQTQTDEPIFQRTGVLNIGPADSTFLANVESSAAQWGLPLEKLNREELLARWPQMGLPEGFIGLFEPNSGVLRSDEAVKTWIKLAEQAGCGQLFNCPVSAIESSAEGVEVETADGRYHGSHLLLSAGTWAKELVPELPITPVRKVFIWHQADGRYARDNKFPAFTGELADGSQYYGFPAENDELKIGRHDGGQPITSPEERKPFGAIASDGAEAFRFLRQCLPGVGVCMHGAACTYDNSPDEDFIIDTVDTAGRILAIAGLSGHGFKFAPALAEIACQFARGEESEFDLTPFRLARFK